MTGISSFAAVTHSNLLHSGYLENFLRFLAKEIWSFFRNSNLKDYNLSKMSPLLRKLSSPDSNHMYSVIFLLSHMLSIQKNMALMCRGSFWAYTLWLNGEKYFLAIKMAVPGQKQAPASRICVNTQTFHEVWWVFCSLVLDANCSCLRLTHLLV